MNACNQKSSREPVVNYNEETVTEALAFLQYKGLVMRISGAGHRVEKFGHRLGEKLNLGRRELALLCVLMLRGPQTVGELRGRTERMHDFVDLEEVERVLESLRRSQAGAAECAPRSRRPMAASGAVGASAGRTGGGRALNPAAHRLRSDAARRTRRGSGARSHRAETTTFESFRRQFE